MLNTLRISFACFTASLNNKYMVDLVSKIIDAESLLTTVGMVHWLKPEDKIPEYEDLLTKEEKIKFNRYSMGEF